VARICRFVIRSELEADCDRVWSHASSMAGVNAELFPLHMRAPPGARLDASLELGRPLMRSVVTLLRCLPIDVHELSLVAVEPGRHFHERSRSLSERCWEHRRTVEPRPGGGSVVEDELRYEPRVFPALMERIVTRVFERRHAYLRRRFGDLTGKPGSSPRIASR
jgi:hypothetical protein